MATNPTDRAFKKLLDKRVTSDSKAVYEEVGDETLTITSDQIWSYDIATNDTATSISDGVVEFKEKISFIEDVTVANQQAWYLEDGYRLTDWVPDRFGANYTAKLFDNSDNQIFPTDSVDWLFDYKTGYLTFETTPSGFSQPFKLDGYRYVGRKGFGAPSSASTYRVVSGEAERDAIPAIERALGMVARYPDGTRFSLGAGLTNSDWQALRNDGYEFYSSQFNTFFTEDIILYVESTGDDSNDGRSVGTAFLTLQRAFDEIPFGYVAYIKISIGAGNFAGGTLSAVSGGGVVYVFGTTTVVETLTRVSDNGVVTNTTSQRDVTANAFSTSIVEGTHFLREPSFTPIFDEGKVLRTSSSPNLNIVSGFSQSWATAQLVTYDTNITSTISGSVNDSSSASLNIQFLNLDTSGTLHFPSNVSLIYISCTGANNLQITTLGAFSGVYCNSLVVIIKENLKINVRGCIFDNQVQFSAQSIAWGQLRGNVFGGTTTKIWVDGEGASSLAIDGINGIDFEGPGTCILLRGKSRIRFDGSIACNGTGALFDIGEQSIIIFDNIGGIYGTVTSPILVNSGSMISGEVNTLKSIALSGGLNNTATPGDDIQVGDSTAPIDSFSSLPITDLTTLSRAK